MDFKLSFQLLFSLFSLDPKNMRWFNARRFFISLILLPVFVMVLLTNRFFMILDYLFFPFFSHQKINGPVFIVAAPRSATTYLFHLLTAKKESFTSFKLWEIIFAPSIIQKYLILGLRGLDRAIGSPLWKLIQIIEGKIFGKFNRIHLIGLNRPEEDEVILLWNMSTIYLNFFFPDTKYFENYADYDHSMSEGLKGRINKYYLNCIKRHNFVFNRKGEKRFLSKNPAMMSKVKMIHELFPDATILNINRNPAKVIPSTLALNDSIYRIFTSKRASQKLSQKTIDLLIHWYKMSNENLNLYFKSQYLEIDFDKLVNNDPKTMNEISLSLYLKEGSLGGIPESKSMTGHKSSNTYQLMKEDELNRILLEVPFLSKYCSEIKA